MKEGGGGGLFLRFQHYIYNLVFVPYDFSHICRVLSRHDQRLAQTGVRPQFQVIHVLRSAPGIKPRVSVLTCSQASKKGLVLELSRQMLAAGVTLVGYSQFLFVCGCRIRTRLRMATDIGECMIPDM